MPYHNPNSRSRRNVLRIVGVLVVLAVIAGVANFLHATTSEAAGNVKPQIETMQAESVLQKARLASGQKSITHS